MLVAEARHSLGGRDSQGYDYMNTHRLVLVTAAALGDLISPPGAVQAVSTLCSLSSPQLPSGPVASRSFSS